MSVASVGNAEMSIDGPRFRVIAETGSFLEDIPGTGDEETTAGILLILLNDLSRNSRRLC